MNEIYKKTAVELANMICQKEVSSVEVVRAFLERIERHDPGINAFITLEEEKAMEAAKRAEKQLESGENVGLLHGVPVAVKDNVFTAGTRTTCGSRLLENYIPGEDAVLVKRLKEAGAIVLGKTNLPEFALLPITDSPVAGATRNPWNPEKTPGGSSGGSAAGVAAGLFPAATGNDGGGSIRIPASLCGVYGIKPSFGRVPVHPRFPGWETMTHEGPLTRSVEDAAVMLKIMAGPHRGDRQSLPPGDLNYTEALRRSVKGMRLAYSPDLGHALVDPEVKKITEKAARAFEDMGCVVEEVSLDIPDMEADLQTMVAAEFGAVVEPYLEEWKKVAYPPYLGLLHRTKEITGKDMARVQFRREELWSRLHHIWEKYHLLLTPATAVPAFNSGEGGPAGPETIDGKEVGPISWIALTFPFNFTGQPAASVPCGFTGEGLPVGLQLVGDRFDEHAVLAASAAWERAHPWPGCFLE